MKKKIIYLIIGFIVLISILCLFNKTKYDNKIISDSFIYEETITYEEIESKYYYSDSYFSKKSSKENEHLRTFAMDLAITFIPTDNNKYIQKIYDGIGLKDIKYYDDEIITKDTIGTSIGHKKLNNKYELVVLVIRGAGYQDEWISNFTIGDNGNVKGFDEASKLVLSRLKDYLKDNNIGKYKLLVTGYSRGGAVSNLIGVTLNNDSSYHIKSNDLYVYTFDAPLVSINNKTYKNIHNIVNKNDIITYLYSNKLGLYNNGNIYDITDNNRKIKSKCLNILSKGKIVKGKEIYKQDFINSFINLLPNNREEYVKISNSIINFYSLFTTKTDDEINKIFKFVGKYFVDEINFKDVIVLINTNDENKIKEVFDKVSANYDINYDEIKDVLSKEEYNNIKEDIYKLFVFFIPMIKEDFKYSDNNNTCSMYHTLTLITNFEEIIKEHTFTNNYNLVKSKDSNYK